MTRQRLLFALVSGIVCIMLLLPFDLTIARERKLAVVNIAGEPIATARVQQTWYQYSLNVRDEVESSVDNTGRLLLPKRAVRTTAGAILLGALREFMSTTIHASYGSDEFITVFASGYETRDLADKHGWEVPRSGVIVLTKRLNEGIKGTD